MRMPPAERRNEAALMTETQGPQVLQPQILQRITITRELLDDGSETYGVEYEDRDNDTDLIGWLDGLALLEAAKFDLYERHRDPKAAQ